MRGVRREAWVVRCQTLDVRGMVGRREKLGARANMGTVPAVSPGTKGNRGTVPVCARRISPHSLLLTLNNQSSYKFEVIY